MQLIGMLDSPFVRRVAITMQMLGIEYEHRPLSVLRAYDEFRRVNPLVKVPTLVLGNGEMLVDSTLIISYLETLAGRSLMPAEPVEQAGALQQIGIALVAAEKVAQRIYELKMRPEEYRYGPWLNRVNEQLVAALDQLEQSVAGIAADQWRQGDSMTQADVTTAVVWRFAVYAAPKITNANTRPALIAFSERAEAQPEFIACPIE